MGPKQEQAPPRTHLVEKAQVALEDAGAACWDRGPEVRIQDLQARGGLEWAGCLAGWVEQ